MHTNTHPLDYKHKYPIISQPQRLCTECGGYVHPDLHNADKLTCLSCKGTSWEWVQEAESAEYRAAFSSAKQIKHTPYDFTPVFEVNHDPCPACIARATCKKICQVRKQYNLKNRDPRTLAQIEMDLQADDWNAQIKELRGGL